MRSHVTSMAGVVALSIFLFQYRKRYEVTCDQNLFTQGNKEFTFQYRKRYEVTCDLPERSYQASHMSFNTASGMRSHVTY